MLIFIDECGVGQAPVVARTWAPRGQTPVLRHIWTRDHLSVISGVSLGGKLYVNVHRDSMESKNATDFLEHVHRHSRRRLLVIWDKGSIHTSRETQDFLHRNRDWVEAHFLPGYSPQLNPDEGFNSQLKYHELKNFTPRTMGELKRGMRLAVMRIRAKSRLVRGFFRQSGIVRKRGRGWVYAN